MTTAIAAPSAAPGRGPEHVRIGERVAEQPLERRAGHGQAGPTTIAVRTRGSRRSQTIVSARGDQVRAEVDPEQAVGEDRDRVGRGDRDGPEPDPQDEGDGQGDEAADPASTTGDGASRATACPEAGPTAIVAVAWPRRSAAPPGSVPPTAAPRPGGSPGRARAARRRGADRAG